MNAYYPCTLMLMFLGPSSDLYLHNLSILVDYLDAVKYIHQAEQSCHLAECDTEVHLAAE